MLLNRSLRIGLTSRFAQIQQAAAKAGIDPMTFCSKGADIFKVHTVSHFGEDTT